MKKLKYTLVLLFIFLLSGIFSCNMDDELVENPKDFISPENSFVDKAGFESALAHIYRNVRSYFYSNWDEFQTFDMLGIDVDFADINWGTGFSEYFYWNTLNADNSFSEKWWWRLYALVFRANVIIDRADTPTATWQSEEEKNAIIGEAKFIRAWAYHFLGNMWGGVPLVLHETTSAKFDYTRATQEEVYKQCKEDLEFAVEWMQSIDNLEGGRASRSAAYHLLSEVDICLEDYDGAITAAGNIINDPNFYLMTERFGTYKDFTFNGYTYKGAAKPWGDVYWDLFQEGNMNWIEGNHEAIWNMEMDYSTLGGGNNTYGGYFVLERWWGLPVASLKDINGVKNAIKDTCAGRPAGVLKISDYAATQIWTYKNDWDRDMRNSEYNIQRHYYWLNPQSVFYGQEITKESMGDPSLYERNVCNPSFKKAIPAVHHGMFYEEGQANEGGGIFKDWYIMRLPETLLLRAEAYFRKGDLEKAAADINLIRNRAQATPVSVSDVNLDLILDERARELYMEEFRLNTLMRMEKLPEYLMKYNKVVKTNGYTLDSHINKLPIPSSEIEANTGAVLEQNPGYN